MKEGVKDDCQDNDDFGAFGGDWGNFDDDDYYEEKDYSDYVQPTKKPLIFKELYNDKPLSTRRKYDQSRKKKTTERSYEKIPDLPPPASFPDLFSSMPGGGFMNSNTDPQLTVRRPPTSRTKERGPEQELSYSKKMDVDIVNSGNSGMYQKNMIPGYQSTAKPWYTTARQAYNAPTSPSPQPVYTTPKPIYTTPRQSYDYHTTARRKYTTAYDYHTTARPSYTTPRQSYDYHTTPKSKYTTPKFTYDYYTTVHPSFTTAHQAYDYQTTFAPRIRQTSPRAPADTPYKFYTPRPSSLDHEENVPAPLPPPGNFPKFSNKEKNWKKEDTRRADQDKNPMRKQNAPAPYTPLQTLLNPLKNIFGMGRNRRVTQPPMRKERKPIREERPSPRRQEPERMDVPAPLPPPKEFPAFDDNTNELATEKRRRRRKKRPKRPLIDTSPKYKGSYGDYDDTPSFKDLMQRRPSIVQDGGRRKEEARLHLPSRRKMFRKPPRHGYRDQIYSPSENEETMTMMDESPVPSYAPATNLGLGVFNPKAIVSESGFTPVMQGIGNAPSLAFSIFEDGIGGQAGSQAGSTMMDRMDSFSGVETTGDRGNVVVDIPGEDILPYMVRQPVQRSLYVKESKMATGDPWENLIKRNTGSSIEAMQDKDSAMQTTRLNSADFHSFHTVAGQEDNLNVRRVHEIQLAPEQLESDSPLLLSVGSSLSYGPTQPQRVGSSVAVGSVGGPNFIHRQMLTAPDGTSLAYGNVADYGKAHPSYVQQDVQTRVGNMASRELDTSEDVVYGKMSETPSAPLESLGMDSRLLEKLALLEETEGKQGAEAVVSDLWSIMKQNEG